MKKYFFLIYLFSLLIPFHIYCNTTSYRFKSIGIDEGLSNSIVNDIIQDQKGFIWFATQDGLNRFDGYTFKVFNNRLDDPSSIRENQLSRLFVDHMGNIWVSFGSSGLTMYDTRLEHFNNYNPSREIENHIGNSYVLCFFEDRHNRLWVGTENGLYQYEPYSREMNYIPLTSDPLNPVPVRTIKQDKKGNIWIGSSDRNSKNGKGIFVINPEGSLIRDFNQRKKDGLTVNYITSLHIDNNGSIWAGSWGNGLFVLDQPDPGNPKLADASFKNVIDDNHFNTKKDFIYDLYEDKKSNLWIMSLWGLSKVNTHYHDQIQHYDFSPIYKDGTGDLVIKGIVEDLNENIWIYSSSSDLGLCIFDETNNRFEHFKHDPLSEESIGSNKIRKVFVDQQNSLWIASNELEILDLQQKKFHTYRHSALDPASISSNNIFGITEDLEGDIWIATRNGLNRFDKKNGTFTNFTHNPADPGSINSNNISVLFTDSNGRIWIGYFYAQLSVFNPKDGSNKQFREVYGDTASFNAYSIRAITETEDGSIWIGSKSRGLWRYSDGQFMKINLQDQPVKSIKDVMALYPDKSKNLWIGTSQSGLIKLDLTTGEFEYFMANDHPWLTDNFIKCIRGTDDGKLWLGTNNGGLILFDPATEQGRYFTDNDGLPSNMVNGVLIDQTGLLWITTNKGLSLFDPVNYTFQNFFKEDGIQSNEFNIGSYYKSKEGLIFAGGVNGLTVFDPAEIETNHLHPPMVITSFKLFNSDVEIGAQYKGRSILDESITYSNSIVLTHKHTVFSLEFASLHYSMANNIQYAYMIKGFDEDWNFTNSTRRHVTYTNLPSGKYTFMVKATNKDGIWNENATEISLLVLPPWWETWWFRGIVALSLIVALIGVVKFRTRALIARKKELEIQVKERTEELQIANNSLEFTKEKIELQKIEIEAQRDNLAIQNNNMKLLSVVGQNITALMDMEHIISELYHQLNLTMDASHFAIGQVNSDSNSIDFLAYSEMTNAIYKNSLNLDNDERMSIWCIKNNQIVFMNDVENDIEKFFNKKVSGYTSSDSPKSSIYLPLNNRDQQTTGILIVKSYKKNSYTNQDLQFLKNLASYIAIALDNTRAYNQIQTQSEKLQSVVEAKTRFFMNVSHEFRTPLTLLKGPLEKMMLDTKMIKEFPYANNLHRMMYKNTNRLLNLVNELLEVRKIETGMKALKLVNEDFNSFIKSLVGLFGDAIIQKNIRLNWENETGKLHMYFDPSIIEKVIINLLSNALKFTPSGGSITVVCDIGNDSLNTDSIFPVVIITIMDSGIGIPEPELIRIFDRFYNINDKRTSDFSSGIGLSVAKDLIEMHKGKITVKSIEGKGSEFNVYIPLVAVDPEKTYGLNVEIENESISKINNFDLPGYSVEMSLQKPDIFQIANSGEEQKPIILLIDDNTDIIYFLSDELKDCFHVISAFNGIDGLNYCFETIPDLIISDIMMPGLDGLSLCRKLKNDERTSHIPIILLTAKGGMENEIEGFESGGADDYISKPFSSEILKARIHSIIKNREALKKAFKLGSQDKNLPNPEKEFLNKVITIIEENLDEPEFNNEILQKSIGMSKTQLYRKIKALTHMSVIDFVKEIKYRKASMMLLNTDKNISEIAYSLGYSTSQNFSRDFKSRFGCTPTKYKSNTLM